MGSEIFGVLEMGWQMLLYLENGGKKKFLFFLKILPPLSPALKMTAPLAGVSNNQRRFIINIIIVWVTC